MLISHRRFSRCKWKLPRARGSWFLDSSAFSELSQYGEWTIPSRSYAEAARRYAAEIGNLEFAAPQDWPCEPSMLTRTRSTVRQHQLASVQSFLKLCELVPEVPWIPVLQGFAPADYWRCIELYESAGVSLSAERLVGLGSVCRRQHTREIRELIAQLSRAGLALHGFGVKMRAIEFSAEDLESADSAAWSFHARRRDPLPGCPHANCNTCLRYALRWRRRVLRCL